MRALRILGELLKRQRESLNLSEKEISALMNQPSANFIPLIERGACNIPLSKVDDIARAYRLGPAFSLVLIKYLHPEVWHSAGCALEEGKRFAPEYSRDDVDKSIDDCLASKLRELGMEPQGCTQ